MCVLSQRFTAGDLSLSFINNPPQLTPSKRGGFLFLLDVWVFLLFVSVTVTSVTSVTVCYMCGGARGVRGLAFTRVC